MGFFALILLMACVLFWVVVIAVGIFWGLVSGLIAVVVLAIIFSLAVSAIISYMDYIYHKKNHNDTDSKSGT